MKRGLSGPTNTELGTAQILRTDDFLGPSSEIIVCYDRVISIGIACNVELRKQRPEKLLVRAPAANGIIVNRLTHLHRTGGKNRPLRLMESKTPWIPV
jgi:hypothetical protein